MDRSWIGIDWHWELIKELPVYGKEKQKEYLTNVAKALHYAGHAVI